MRQKLYYMATSDNGALWATIEAGKGARGIALAVAAAGATADPGATYTVQSGPVDGPCNATVATYIAEAGKPAVRQSIKRGARR